MNKKDYVYGVFSGMLILCIALCLWTHFANWVAVPFTISALGTVFSALSAHSDW